MSGIKEKDSLGDGATETGARHQQPCQEAQAAHVMQVQSKRFGWPKRRHDLSFFFFKKKKISSDGGHRDKFAIRLTVGQSDTWTSVMSAELIQTYLSR